jgi:hypothetical protein
MSVIHVAAAPVAAPVLTQAEMMAEIQRLTNLNAKLSAVKSNGLSFRVSEKGAVSVYGLGRFPVTLYREQWAKLFGEAEGLKAFIDSNTTKLKVKPPKEIKGTDTDSEFAE